MAAVTVETSRPRPPRFPLAVLPTPLQRAERLERALGAPPLYVKRDDLTGFALAGNKTRKLEFIVADAVAKGADLLLTGGGAGSNHCQAAAAAAAVAGLECLLILYGDEPADPHPNLRLARAFGADTRFTGEPRRESVDERLEAAGAALRAEGRLPYVVPRGGASPLGVLGYVLAVEEVSSQLRGLGVEPEVILVATGSCGTQAGLVAGTEAAGLGWRVVGASVSRPVGECRRRVLHLAGTAAALLDGRAPDPRRVDVRDARGPGYGLPSAAGEEAARVAATSEGLLLDPVFTAKALGLLPTLLHEGTQGPIVFWHTGGTASLLAARGGRGV